MARDIEEFLKRAAERRKQQQQKRGSPPPKKPKRVIESAEIEIVEPIQVVEPARTRKFSNRKPVQPQRGLREQSVAEHVRQHIDTRDVSEHAEHLGEDIQLADDRISERIHRKFDHDVGQLDEKPSVQDDVVPIVEQVQASQLAKDLVGMLSNPQSARQAILISEILSRPNFD